MSANVVEVLPGLLRFTVPFPEDPRRHVNSYLLVSGPDALLVDAAWDTAEAAEGLEQTLATAGLKPGAIRTVVVTHLHADHVGLVSRLQTLGARIAYHTAETMTLLMRYRHMDEFQHHSRLWAELNGYPQDEPLGTSSVHAARAVLTRLPEPDLPLRGGEVLSVGGFRLRPVWTPGHTLGHLCFYEETRQLLFTGDHVLPTISPHVGLYVHSVGNPLSHYLDSLRLLVPYNVELVLPAHGEPFADLRGRLAELQEHHHERMEELFEIVQAEPLTAWEVASRARWTRRRVGLKDLSAFHRRLALAETMAHLDLMRAEGRIEQAASGGLLLHREARPVRSTRETAH